MTFEKEMEIEFLKLQGYAKIFNKLFESMEKPVNKSEGEGGDCKLLAQK